MTKGELRKQRQAEHAIRLAARAMDTRNALERYYDMVVEDGRIRRRTRRPRVQSRSPIVGSAEWAETRGDDLGLGEDY